MSFSNWTKLGECCLYINGRMYVPVSYSNWTKLGECCLYINGRMYVPVSYSNWTKLGEHCVRKLCTCQLATVIGRSWVNSVCA